jgi:glycerate kinase
VIASSKKYNIAVASFCGDITLSQKEIDKLGITYTASIIENAESLKDAMANTKDHLKNIASAFAKSID